MQRTGQTLPCQAPSRPSYIPGRPSLNRRCNTRNLAGKSLAGFRATISRRITVSYGMAVYVLRCKTSLLPQ